MYKTQLSNVDALRELVAEKRNIGSCLDALGIRRSGKSYQTFREVCEAHGIDLDFPEAYASTRMVPNSEIFVENSKYTNNRIELKKKALRAGYLPDNSCSICSQGPVWNGKPLVLQLDHINGINNDNRPENLRLLCPNCHTQTDTFAGKKRKT